MSGDYYVLDGRTPRPEPDLLTWARWLETADRRVALTELSDGGLVSTVFLGLDHRFFGGPPLVFETMAFDGRGEIVAQDRYSTWEEAEAGHAEIAARLANQ